MGSLSAKSGVAENTILAIEKGRGNPTLQTLNALAISLDVTLQDFLGKSPDKPGRHLKSASPEGKQPPNFDEFFELFSRYRDLKPVRKALIAALIYDDQSYLIPYPTIAPIAVALRKVDSSKK